MRGSWRLALRLARRDIAAHRVRSGLIVAMIGLPVFVIVAAITLFATSTLDTDEALPGTLGAAQARVVVQDVPLEQNADGTSIARRCGDGSVEGYMPTELWSFPISGDDTCRVAATPTSLPGVRDTTSLAEVTAGLERRTGANATPIRDTQLALVRDDLTTYFPVLEVDGRDPATAGMLTLTSGRWPTHRDEVLITRRAIAQGFPESGTVQPAPLEPGTRPAAVTVVGTVDIAPRRYVALSLVRLPEDTAVGTAYLLQRDTPFLWDEVRSLNADGVAVASRALVEDPGAAAVVDLGLGVPQTSPDGTAAIVTVATVGLLFAGCLVAGPAFVVIAARRRRDMALLAATGARVTDLRGVLLAQGLLLGALAAVVGAVLGVAVAVGGVVVTGRWWPLLILWGPIDVPVSPILLIALAAVAAALISAALPARGLATLDLRAAVDADAAPSPAPHPTRALLGVLLVAAGAGFFICFLALDTGVGGVLHDPSADPDVAFWLRSFIVTAGALCVVSGALLLVPAALQRLSAAAATWPPVPRLAMRDIARSHRRAVPTVAAVMGGAMLLAGLGVVSWSEDSLARERHMPIAPPGQAIATVLHDDIDGRREQLDAAAPGNRARLVTFPESRADTDPSPDAPPVTTSWVVLPPHCPEAAFLVDEPRSGACLEAAGSAPYSLPPIVVLDPADAADLFGLTDDQRRLLDEGGVLLPTGGAPARSEVTLAAATWIDAPQDVTPVAVRIAETIPRIEYGFLGQPPGAVISDTTAERLGMDWRVGQFIIGSADGPLSDADARALEALPRTDAREPVQIERGPQSPFRLIWSGAAIVFGLLIIIAVVTATALAQGEARRDIAVLTSLGATSGITRRIAALQAALLAGIGAVLGAAAAFIPALTVVISATTSDLRPFTGGWIDLWNAATIVIPWGWMLLAVATIALIAAGVAAAITRPAPALSRRVT